MDELRFYSSGQTNTLEILKEKFESLKSEVRKNKSLTESQKKTKLTELKKSFEKQKKELNNNLY